MSVTAPAGFEAAGIAAGIKRTGASTSRRRQPRAAQGGAAVFTCNRAKANPILWSQQVIQDGTVEAIVLNSAARTASRALEGFQITHRTAEAAARPARRRAGDVLVCSTGLIGDQLDGEVLEEGVLGREQASPLTADGGDAAARAIMTTDSKPKTVGGRGRRMAHRRHGEGRRDAGARPRDDARRASRPTPTSTPRRLDAALRAPTRSPSTGSTPTAACRRTTRSR